MVSSVLMCFLYRHVSSYWIASQLSMISITTPRHNSTLQLLHHERDDVILSTMAYQITGVWSVYSTICPGGDGRKDQSSASMALVRGNHWESTNSPHKGPVTREMFPFDAVIINAALTERTYEFDVLREIVLRASAPRGLAALFYRMSDVVLQVTYSLHLSFIVRTACSFICHSRNLWYHR